jgi:hypothetical protein
MRKGNINTNIIYPSIPFQWTNEDGYVAAYYNLLDPSIHYRDGFRDVIEPTPTETQRVGDSFYDANDDVFKFNLIDLTQEEIDARLQAEAERPLIEEFEKYRQRKEDGINAFLKISAELRLAKLSGQLDEQSQRVVELTIEPVRDEVVLGQWISAKEKLEEIGSSVIGEDFYNRVLNELTSYIVKNY